MASDLVAHHYQHTAPAFTLHTPPSAFPSTPSPTLFTLHTPSLAVSRIWLILHSPDALPSPSEQLYNLLATPELAGNHRKLTINTYDKRVVTWAMGLGNRFMKVEVFYEMLLKVSPAAAATVQGRAVDGYKVQRGEEWFCAKFPEKARTVSVGGEEVHVVVVAAADADAADVVAWMTVVRSGERSYVSSLTTLEEYRGRRLATMLLCSFLESRSPGDEVWLTARCENFRAVELFVRIGWKTQRCLWVVGHGGGED